MKQNAIYTDKQPPVVYSVVNENRADVIVNKFLKEKKDSTEDVCFVSFEYETNIFSVDPKEITQEMIENNIDYYLNNDDRKETVEEKIKKLQDENDLLKQCIIEMSEVVYGG